MDFGRVYRIEVSSGYGYASLYPEMRPALQRRKLLEAKVDGPDGMSPFFPGPKHVDRSS